MLKLIKEWKQFQSYAEYYDTFPYTRDRLGYNKQENEYNKIASMLQTSHICFVEGRNIISSKSNNLLPFLDSRQDQKASEPLFNSVSFDRYTETKLSFLEIVDNFTDWVVRLLTICTDLRVIVIDFSPNAQPPYKCDLENNVDSYFLYERKEMQDMTNKFYTKLSRNFRMRLKTAMRKVKMTPKDPVRIITHYGGSHLSPSIVTIFTREDDGTGDIDFQDSYYINRNEIVPNEWIYRYMYTEDSIGFFTDLMASNGMKDYSNFMIYTSDNNCVPSLIRTCMENNSRIKALNLVLFSDDEDTIVTEIWKVQKLMFTALAQGNGFRGTSSELLSDIFMIGVCSHFYTNMETLIADYKTIRVDKPVNKVNWNTLGIETDGQKLSTLSITIKDNSQGITSIMENVALASFMSDMEFVMSPPLSLDLSIPLSRDKWFYGCVINIRIWMMKYIDFTYADEENNRMEYLNRSVCFLTFPYVLIALMPKLKELYGDTIVNMNGVATLLRESQSMEAESAREFFTMEGMKTAYEIGRKHIESDGIQFDNGEENLSWDDIVIDRDVNQMEIFEQMLTLYKDIIKAGYQNNEGEFSIRKFIYPRDVTSEIMSPFEYEIGVRRLEFFEKEGLITNEGETFTFKTMGEDKLDSSEFSRRIQGRFNYQLLRKHPSAWKYWTGQKSIIDSVDLKTATDYLAKSKSFKEDPNKPAVLAQSEIAYRRYANGIYKWNKFPPSVPNSTRTLFSSHPDGSDFVDIENRLWRIIRKLVPITTEPIGTESEKAFVTYEFKVVRANPIKDDIIKYGNTYLWKSLVPETNAMKKNFSLLLPILQMGIFCLGIPEEWLIMNDKTVVYDSIEFPRLTLSEVNRVLDIPIFSSVANYSVYDLYRLLSCLRRMKSSWINAIIDNTVFGFLTLCVEAVFDPNFYDMDLEDYDDLSQTEVDTMLQNNFPAIYAVKTELTKIGTNVGLNLKKVVKIVKQISADCSIKGSDNNGKIVDFIVSCFEYMDEMHRHALIHVKQDYLLALEFSFDIYQPLYTPTSGDKKGKLLKRVYEYVTNDDVESDEERKQDLDSFFIDLRNLKYSGYGYGPEEQWVVQKDPIDGKKYMCLAFDCDKFNEWLVSNNMSLLKATSNNTASTSNIYREYMHMEYSASIWWANSPKLRAKINSRLRGGTEWNSAKWACWLIKAFESDRMDFIGTTNLGQWFSQATKVIYVTTAAKTRPVGELFSKEYGVLYHKKWKNLKYNICELINFRYNPISAKARTKFLSPWNEYTQQLISPPPGMVGSPVNMSNSAAKKILDESDFARMDKRQRFNEIMNKLSVNQPWYHVDNYVDLTEENTSFNGSGNCCYVYLPRYSGEYTIYNPPLFDKNNFRYGHDNPLASPPIYRKIPDNVPGEGVAGLDNLDIKIQKSKHIRDFAPSITVLEQVVIGVDDIISGDSKSDNPALENIIQYVVRFVPVTYGSFYVFSAYNEVRLIFLKEDRESGKVKQVKYEEFHNDKSLSKDSPYFYRVGFDLKNVENSAIIFQGVYGNTCRRTDIYYQFMWASRGMKVWEDDNNLTTSPRSIEDMTQLYAYRYKWNYRKLKSMAENIESIEIPIFLYSNTIDDGKYTFYSDRTSLISNHKYGFFSDNAWITIIMESVCEWFAISQVSGNIIPSLYDAATSTQSLIRGNFVDKWITCAKWPSGDGGIVPFVSNFYDLDIYTEDLTRNIEEFWPIFIQDVCQFALQLTIAFDSYRYGKKMDMSTYLFLIDIMEKFSIYRNFIELEYFLPCMFKSKKFFKDVFDYILEDTLAKFPDENGSWKDTKVFLNKLADSTDFMFVSTEKDYTSLKDKAKIINRIETKYRLNIQGQDRLEERFNNYDVDIESYIPDKLSFLLENYREIRKNKFYKAIIDKAPRKNLMASVIKRMVAGSATFPTTNKNYSDLGIYVDMGGAGDNGALWESISENLDDMAQMFFLSSDTTDLKLDKLDREINGDKFRGWAKDSKIKARDKIIRELTDGRKLMLFFYNETPRDWWKDEQFIQLLYDIYDARSPYEINTNAHVSRGANKFDIEYQMRGEVGLELEKYRLFLVYRGDYDRKEVGSVDPDKVNLKTYRDGLTMYMTAHKKQKFKILAVDTFLESLLICIMYEIGAIEHRQKRYYLKYKTMGQIVQEYAEIPSIMTEQNGGEPELKPVVKILDLDVLHNTFSQNPDTVLVKTVTYFNTSLSSQLNINLNIYRFVVNNEKVIFKELTELRNTREMENTTTVSLVLVQIESGKKKFSFFEPTFKF